MGRQRNGGNFKVKNVKSNQKWWFVITAAAANYHPCKAFGVDPDHRRTCTLDLAKFQDPVHDAYGDDPGRRRTPCTGDGRRRAHGSLNFFKVPQTVVRNLFRLQRQLPTPFFRREPADATSRRYVRLKRTNLRVIGLSLNRSQKRSALLSTTPRLRTRSSTNDLAPPRRMW